MSEEVCAVPETESGEPVRLTAMTSAAGWAAKWDPASLAQVMRPLEIFNSIDDPDLLIGLAQPDDAAVYRVGDNKAIIVTTDLITPIVDDPYQFGAIAAANALSDVYAMGGKAVFALNIACFPKSLPMDIAREIIRGGADKVLEANAVIAGGHTVDDKEPKYGLAVVGLVDTDLIMEKGGAQVGDQLVLTKPLGVGVVTTALKSDRAAKSSVELAVESMMRLNRSAAEAMMGCDCHAATDVTGFSLLGHGWEMASQSKARFEFDWDALRFIPGAIDLAEQGYFPGGAGNNQKAYAHVVSFDARITPAMQKLLFTPETSGGLLVSLSPQETPGFIQRCADRQLQAYTVGRVTAGEGIHVK